MTYDIFLRFMGDLFVSTAHSWQVFDDEGIYITFGKDNEVISITYNHVDSCVDLRYSYYDGIGIKYDMGFIQNVTDLTKLCNMLFSECDGIGTKVKYINDFKMHYDVLN